MIRDKWKRKFDKVIGDVLYHYDLANYYHTLDYDEAEALMDEVALDYDVRPFLIILSHGASS